MLVSANKTGRLERPATFRVENEYDADAIPQYFQVCVNVLEARKLVWSKPEHMNSFVVVTVGDRKRRTAVKKNMEQPFYREYFVFEMFACAGEMQRASVSLAVMEPRCCAPTRMLGLAFVDLSAVWGQPHHQIYHKWAQLSLPKDAAAGPRGFLKVDICILCRGEVQYIPPSVKNDTVEENLLPPTIAEQQRANYLITIYRAYGIPSGGHNTNENGRAKNVKPPSTFVRITYCGILIKTSVQARTFNPFFNEQISITEMFPNVNQHVRFEVCSVDNCGAKVLCTTHLRMDEISHDGESGFLPTFGPCPVHMYGDVGRSQGCVSAGGPYYRGALLLSCRTVVPYYQQGLRSVNVEPITPLVEDLAWSCEDFYLFCPMLEVSMLDKSLTGRTCGIAITMGEGYADTSFDEEAQVLADEIKMKKAYYTGQLKVFRNKGVYGSLDFEHTFPVLQMLKRYPDFRARIYKNNMVNRIVYNIEHTVSEVERRLSTHEYDTLEQVDDILERGTDDTVAAIQIFLDIDKYSKQRGKGVDFVQKHFTELDEKQLAHQKAEMHKIQRELRGRSGPRWLLKKSLTNLRARSSGTLISQVGISRKLIKLKLAETKLVVENLKKLVFKTSDGWPDLVVWLVSGSTRVAYVKLTPGDILYSPIGEQCGRKCSQFETFYLKPVKCPKHLTFSETGCVCVAARVEMCCWLGLLRQRVAVTSLLPDSHEPVKCPKHLTSPETGCVCVAARVEMCCWLGLLRQRAAVTSLLPDSHEVNVSGAAGLATYVTANAMYLECRAFVYRAKLSGGADASGLADPFVRVNIFNQYAETQIMYKNLTPVWNRVVKVQSLTYSSPDRFQSNPAMVLVEVYDSDARGKSEIIGRVQIAAVLADDLDYAFAPKLQWFDLFKGPQCTGQILMSVQLVQITDITETNVNDTEALPASLMPEYTTYKIDVYWWGLRDISSKRKPRAILELDDLSIKSESIPEVKSNCNFPNGRHTQTFEAPLKEAYCPPMSIRLYDNGTFGRTVYLGTNVLKSPTKFLVDWMPKLQRDASLHSVSFDTNTFSFGNLFHTSGNNTSRSSKTVIKPPSKPPPISSRLRRWFHRSPTVATAVSIRRTDYTLLPLSTNREIVKNRPYNDSGPTKDWWVRFTCSQKTCVGDNLRPGDEIVIYNSELENQEGFSKFKDWCHTLKLYNGKKTGVPEKDEKLYCGYLKAGIAIYKWPPPEETVAVTNSGVDLTRGYFYEHPTNEPKTYLVRIYIVKGFNLMPKDLSGKSDPYVLVKCGKRQLGERKHYVAKTINPIFGRMFEFRAALPDDYLITVTVNDYDKCSCSDDLIGKTTIDIEDRVFSKHRATCGLAAEYCTTGCNQWRDCFKPSNILEQLCIQNHLPAPIFPDSKSVLVNGIEYKAPAKGDFMADVEKKENICLNLLKKWHTIPLCGHHLVPEHVETRTLFNPDKPGLDQGKIQLWVDIFPLDVGLPIPAAIPIEPRKPDEFELRVTVWDVVGIALDDYNFVTGDRASDIYVKAWIGDPGQAQTTDIHYRSLTGEGNFNWRMIFAFNYQHAERRLITKETGMFAEQGVDHIPPILQVIVMDNDTISSDDFLGSLSLDLNSMSRGAKTSRYCSLANDAKAPRINLFHTYMVRGWWPMRNIETTTGKEIPAGKIDLEINLLTKSKANLQPAGLGREGPQPLDPPRRPVTSFNFFTNPLLSIKSMLKRRGWKAAFLIIGIFLFLLITFSIILELPRIILERIVDRLW